MNQPLKPQITRAKVTYPNGRTRFFACTTAAAVQRMTDLHFISHARPITFLGHDDSIVLQLPAAPAVVRCRNCGDALRRIGQGHGHMAESLFCDAHCGYAYAVASVREEERPHAVMTREEVAQRRGQERTDTKLADERARGAAKTAELLARRGGR